MRDPSIPAKVADLYVMGGGIGNITPAAEYNFHVDPEAAKLVVNAGFPLTLFTWTLTRTHGVFDDDKLAVVDVETSGDLTRGWSLIDTLGRTGREPNARVVTDYDTNGFFELMLSVLS
jgi:inosine-uridine nucleoside N-ribohydrolase